MSAKVPLWAAFLLALATAASAATLAEPSLRPVGKPARGWILDPLLVRGADGKAKPDAVRAALSVISDFRSGGEEMQAVPRADEIDELAALLEDVLPAAPASGVQIYFAGDERGVEVRWPDALGHGYVEASGRFEKALVDDGPNTGLALSLWARKIVGSEAPPAALVAQYIPHGVRLAIKRRESRTSGEPQPPQSLAVERTAGPDPAWIAEALRRLPEAVAASRKPGLFPTSPESAVFKAVDESAPCGEKDLSGLFPEPVSRNQGDVGSCHIFAALAPLEAALYRMYGLHIALSEADLFVRNKIRTEEFWKSGWTEEAGFTQKDLEFARGHGVATARSAPYSEMEPRYTALRDKTQQLIAQVNEMPDAGLLDGWYAARDAATGKESKQLLGSPTKVLDGERALIKRALAPVKLEHWEYEPTAAGVTQKKDIIDYLCKGVPVAISMNLVGLPEWGHRGSTRDSEHAFIVKGFRRTLENGLVFTTRNSWGDVADNVPTPNPDIPETLLSRVDEIDAALPPSSGAPDPAFVEKLRALAEKR